MDALVFSHLQYCDFIWHAAVPRRLIALPGYSIGPVGLVLKSRRDSKLTAQELAVKIGWVTPSDKANIHLVSSQVFFKFNYIIILPYYVSKHLRLFFDYFSAKGHLQRF